MLFGGITVSNRPDPENIRKLDVLPLPMIGSMMRYGMRISPDHSRDLSSRLQSRMAFLRCEITNEIPPEALEHVVNSLDAAEEDEDQDDTVVDDIKRRFNVDSSKKVAELLYDVLRLHITSSVKIKKTKGGDRLSTGKKTLSQLKREHPVVPFILEYRECSKLDGTYAQAMPRHARFHPRGKDCPVCGWHHRTDEYRVHTEIMTTRAVTGRTAHKKPNLANIPVRSKYGREIRALFIASEGCVICDRDLSQIELRILADQSGDTVMIEVYLNDGDIHNRTACGAFGLRPDQLDPVIHRIPSKTANFSIVYGTTEMGLYDQLCDSFGSMGMAQPDWLTEAWCKWFIDQWFKTYAGAKRYLDSLEETARRFKITWTAIGRVRRIPEVRSCHNYIQEAGIRQAANVPIQGYSADIMKLIMGEVGQQLKNLEQYNILTRPLNTIYDALMIESEEDDGDTVQAVMEDVMDNVMVDKQTGISYFKVPIKSDGKILRAWTKE